MAAAQEYGVEIRGSPPVPMPQEPARFVGWTPFGWQPKSRWLSKDYKPLCEMSPGPDLYAVISPMMLRRLPYA